MKFIFYGWFAIGCIFSPAMVSNASAYGLTIQSKDNGQVKIQLLKVRNLMAAGDYYGALRILKNLEKTAPDNAKVFFKSAECYLQLRNFDEAKLALLRAIELEPEQNPDKYFMLAKVYHQMADLLQAQQHYEKFLKSPGIAGDMKKEAEEALMQISFSNELKSRPLPVKIRNLGEAVNSEYHDYNPTLSADGNTLVFTSRRPDTSGKLKDPDDNMYLEDIYITYRDTLTGLWEPAQKIPGSLNTETHDANMGISADGKQLIVYRNMGNKGSGQLFISKLSKNGKWGAATLIPGDVNTSYFESSGCFSPDGKKLYFVSERPKGGLGQGDIWVAEREKRGGQVYYVNAKNLGPKINTPGDEIGVFIHPDGKTLYFSSNGHKGMGGYDIYKSTLEKGQWTTPVNLGYPINTPGDERFFILSTDGSKAYYSSTGIDGGMGMLDIYEIDMTELNAHEKAEGYSGPPMGVFTGKLVDQNAGPLAGLEVKVQRKDDANWQQSISTDESGEFLLTILAGESYTVEVHGPGFKSIRFEFQMPLKEKQTSAYNKVFVLEKQ